MLAFSTSDAILGLWFLFNLMLYYGHPGYVGSSELMADAATHQLLKHLGTGLVSVLPEGLLASHPGGSFRVS